ncbi:SNF1-related protein kinase regulatory subunit gamma-1-like [Cajanus cajan]|uniref:SNF1-related protein kinase regulatory subunit gamma 1 n=1 Tax=Cajanus cajan TaxID=3821 RepID=A0A151U795_CAJCA|nr:SNF1-related protein kinase regulatory subunit gamma-1-like [Cajanus cajan]KYP75195.1 SNF1-related protein kinase regulatory subunit gamma 1 [Cajanus cajan]
MQSQKIVDVLASEDKEKNLTSSLNNDGQHVQIDSGSALQQFLDHIPISSIAGIKNSPVLELKAGDSIRDAIHVLYEKDIFSAAIFDVSDSDTASVRFSDRYIGLIDFTSMVLWCLEEYDKMKNDTMESHLKVIEEDGFFSILDQVPQIGQTKVSELAKSFLWEPFFPVNMDDTVLHALLLLSKHRLHVLPVIQQPEAGLIIGFVTQNAVVQHLLQSSELEWFDSIADKNLSDFRFEGQESPSCVYGDQSVSDALKLLWQNQTCAVAVVDRMTKKLLGNVRNGDVYNLVKNNDILRNRTILTVEEFIHIETDKRETKPAIKQDRGALLTAASLRLKNSFTPKMDLPVANKENETLKQIMEHATATNSSFSFLVNDREQVTGFLTLRDIILQFAPPCVNSSIHGGGFFELALEQSGCQVKNGTMVRKS